MAGVKGRSGGKRPGAGRKRKPAAVLPEALASAKALASDAEDVEGAGSEPSQADGVFDPRPTLELIAKGLQEVSVQQMKALTALLPYVHTKKGEGGKKEQRQDAAKKVAGRFTPAAPPKLAAVGGKKV